MSLFDDVTLEQLEDDPYPTYAELRREAPIAWVPAAGVWFVTRFEDCAAVGTGQHGFVGATAHPTLERTFGRPNILTSGGEEHQDLPPGIDPRLQPGPVNQMIDDLVRPVARHHLSALTDQTSAELMAAYLEPVSVEALRRVMGLDELVDANTLRRWFADLNVGASNFGLDPDKFAIADRASAEIEDVVRPLLARLRTTPDDSMLSHMLWTGRERRASVGRADHAVAQGHPARRHAGARPCGRAAARCSGCSHGPSNWSWSTTTRRSTCRWPYTRASAGSHPLERSNDRRP